MNILYRHSLTLIFILAIALCSHAQSSHSFHLSAAIPSGEFADDDEDDNDSGLASTGLNVGIRLTFPIDENGLHLFTGIDFNFNSLNADVRDDLEDELEDFYDDSDVQFPSYLSVPISGGIGYVANTGNVNLFANAGLTLNFLKMTTFEIEVSDTYYDYFLGTINYEESLTTEYDLASQLGIRIGGGIEIQEQFIIELNYMGLGKHKVDFTTENETNTGVDTRDSDDLNRKVSLVTFGVGILF